METKRCYGCMKSKQMSPICEHCGYDERVQNATHQLPAGTVLQGKYLLGKALGQGGFGITYLGWDMALDIPVAIKEYYPTGVVTRESTYSRSVTLAISNEDTRFAENRDRFLREARTLAKLESVPEVVQVKNFFAENNTAYIVMGYVQGITLKEHMRRSGGRLGVGEVLQLLGPVLEAMGQVHALGLVHRDISPDNIMIQPNKRARLIDFGAAHAATTLGDKSTQAVLKHGFAPVEQYQSRGNLGSWTDVYAMCATIYHCITGLMPPNATDRMMGEEDFRWEALTDLTEYQVATLKRGLTISHKQRIQTMEELCGAFLQWDTGAKEVPVEHVNKTGMQNSRVLEKIPETQGICYERVSSAGTITLVGDEKPHNYTAPIDIQIPHRECHEKSRRNTSDNSTEDGRQIKKSKRKGPAFVFVAVGLLIVTGLLLFVLGGDKLDGSSKASSADSRTSMTEPIVTTSVETRVDHSPLYLDDLSVEEVIDYFCEVCLSSETGNGTLVLQKWTIPVIYQIHGEPTDEDRETIEHFSEELNRISGFPEIREARFSDEATLDIYFCSNSDMVDLLGDWMHGYDAGCTIWHNGQEAIDYGIICVSKDIDQKERNIFIRKQIYQSLGPLRDTELRPGSISGSRYGETLTQVDWLILELLYHPHIKCGMTQQQCETTIRQIYY